MGISRDNEVLIASLGAFFLGAVYLAGLMAYGLVTGNHGVFVFALVSAGFGYLVQIGSMLVPMFRTALLCLWGASVFAAVLGGLMVFIGA